MRCDRARRLFDACWDDELTLAERDWLETHLASCSGCRTEYDEFSRVLELAGSLPRLEARADLAVRVLARARRATTAPDRVGDRAPSWVPVASVAAAAAVLVVAAMLVITGNFSRSPGTVQSGGIVLGPGTPVQRTDAKGTEPMIRPGALKTHVAAIPDSLFDSSKNVEFILPPVVLHRGRPQVLRQFGVEGQQALITF
jgi:predicted anti-sigma-YlaC factor YlaD